ncbi:hypothetical protein B0O99DRAFT_687896 [Bisporella sp. PMI_857]|nr:hypothetical protein B0O99DRAFT_687896 [Bisporella sp. PMI_857]
MATSNKAIWISSENELSLQTITDRYDPVGEQILVEVEYSGINPADIKHGLILGLNDYPSGYEYSGKVIRTGAQAKFSIGDLVLGHNRVNKKKPIYHGSHQNFLIGEHAISKVPQNMPMQDAACISIMVQTAADALFNQLEFSAGTVLGEEPTRRPILIWGGATSVGVAAIQLAKAAGLSPILTTASKHNHDTLKSLGATACFDYRDEDVVERIQSAIQDFGQLQGIFDTVGSSVSSSLCEKCAGDKGITLANTSPQPEKPQWKMVLATRNLDFPMPQAGGKIGIMKSNHQWQDKIDRTFAWCLSHYGIDQQFIIPKVRVVRSADEGIKAMKFVAEGKSSMEKVAIRHPL